MYSKLIPLLPLFALAPAVSATFASSSQDNVAIYWGQNSYNQGSGTLAQQRLVSYCQSTELNVIPLSFLTSIANPSLNFANQEAACSAIAGSNLISCPQIAEDIAKCQSQYGKTILLSIGGATYTEGGFQSEAAAISAAKNLWAVFGPKTSSSAPRPFGSVSVDGFDLDFESSTSNMVPFASTLRSLMDTTSTSTGTQYFLTAAPQCPYPDVADGPMLAGAVSFDAIFVQFYNNYCGAPSYTVGTTSQNTFNFATWDNWAKTVSKNPNVKILLGLPGAPSAAGSGYIPGTALGDIIRYSKQFSSFGGVMLWDMSQVWANPGYLQDVTTALGGSAPSAPNGGGGGIKVPATTVAPVPAPTTMQTVYVPAATPSPVVPVGGGEGSAPAATSVPSAPITTPAPVSNPVLVGGTGNGTPGSAAGTVNEWNQCGGQDWNGGKVCKSGLTCKYYSDWYSMCVAA